MKIDFEAPIWLVPLGVFLGIAIWLAVHYQVTEFQVTNRIIKLEERMNEAERINRSVD